MSKITPPEYFKKGCIYNFGRDVHWEVIDISKRGKYTDVQVSLYGECYKIQQIHDISMFNYEDMRLSSDKMEERDTVNPFNNKLDDILK
jgi:hypothetical protein